MARQESSTPDFATLGLDALASVGPPPDARQSVAGIAVDSREVRDGFVFVAIPGGQLDGAEFAEFAVRQGAVGIVASEAGLETMRRVSGEPKVPVFLCEDPRAFLPRLAARFYPRQPETIAAVTGTNGKTSTAHFLHQIWRSCGRKAVAFGTAGIAGDVVPEGPALTTPEPISLHRLLDELARRGVTHAAMEASSHGLSQHRLDGVRLSAGALTNIARDHLDYHDDLEAYQRAKLRLFAKVLPEGAAAVLNADDPFATRAAAIAAERGLRMVAVGHAADADLRIRAARFTARGQTVSFTWGGQEFGADLSLIGAFQAENVAIAAALAIACGETANEVFAALPALRGVRGRMEKVAERANGAAIYVDYAHTPDALARAIDALGPHCSGQLVVVFGAGGDRDRGKRPLMGKAVKARADIAIVTDDNPRGEDPAEIRAEILSAIPEASEIGDRTAAILSGVDALKASGDCLLIAGKGHEQGQEAGGEIIPFDDAEQARAAVAALDGVDAAIGGRR